MVSLPLNQNFSTTGFNVDFDVLLDDTGMYPGLGLATEIITERHIPYSNTTYIDRGGRGLTKTTLSCLGLFGSASAFSSVIGVKGTLTYNGVYVYPNAVILSISNPKIHVTKTYETWDMEIGIVP